MELLEENTAIASQLCLPSMAGLVFGKSWKSVRNSGRFWLPYFPRRKEVRVRADGLFDPLFLRAWIVSDLLL